MPNNPQPLPVERISHERAREAASRFVRHFFNNEGKKPEIQIPARPNQDDDLVLLQYINQQETAMQPCDVRALEVVAELQRALNWIACRSEAGSAQRQIALDALETARQYINEMKG